MQIEYEDSPSTFAESSYSRPPPQAEEVQDEEVEEEEEEDAEVEAEEAVEDEQTEGVDQPKQKPKRIIKARQSLAEKQIGTTIFPLSRIKKITKADKELDMMTNEAVFMISVATEYFIKHFMEEGYTKARLERRKLVNYKDMASVVARSEEFDFLRDVVPNPISISEALDKRRQKIAVDENPTLYEDEPTAGNGHHEPQDPIHPDDLPPLALSTNPLFPNAIVKRPTNTHSKGAAKAPSQAGDAGKAPATPRVIGGKNGPSTPHSLTTRSSRRSLAAGEGGPEMESPSVGQLQERMDVD